MSGHSKWATTKRKKAVIDAKRGKIFTKLAKLITIAARDGGGDQNSNPGLRMAIDNAKSQSMPKDNIERAILRGTGSGNAAAIETVIYEAYGPAGIGIIIECLTDNRNRTIAEIKAILNRSGGSVASAGAVAYQFEKRGEIIIDESKNNISGEELEMAILDSGALDYEKDENFYIVWCAFVELNTVKTKLEANGIKVDSAESTMIAKNLMTVPEDKHDKILNLLEQIDDLDDVNKVYSNLG